VAPSEAMCSKLTGVVPGAADGDAWFAVSALGPASPSHVGIDDADSGQDVQIKLYWAAADEGQKLFARAGGCFYCFISLSARDALEAAALRHWPRRRASSPPHPSVEDSTWRWASLPQWAGLRLPSASHGAFPLPLAGSCWRGRFPQLNSTSPGLAPCTVPAPPDHSPPTTTWSRFAGVKQLPAIGRRSSPLSKHTSARSLARPPLPSARPTELAMAESAALPHLPSGGATDRDIRTTSTHLCSLITHAGDVVHAR
jgi:hypothetical protein